MDRELKRLKELLMQLPGVGRKTASRYLLHILRSGPEYSKDLSQLFIQVSERLKMCSNCRDFTIDDLCQICMDQSRKPDKLCIVETSQDLEVIEDIGIFDGLYFVLHGLLDPAAKMGPEELGIPHLKEQILKRRPDEIIIALDYTFLGDATSDFLTETIKEIMPDVVITRPSVGVPVGGDLEYLDSNTLKMAFRNRGPIDISILD